MESENKETKTSTPEIDDVEMKSHGGEERQDRKRDGPETRTVVLAPEKKRQRNYFTEVDKAIDYMKEYTSTTRTAIAGSRWIFL